MQLNLTRAEKTGLAVVGVAALAGLVVGWRVFWFLTDDAYIAFRYVSNSRLGYGYVWNPPPFRPVEGYTSFLWVVLLDGIWRLTGIQPPEAANPLALVFAALTLLLGAGMVLRMDLRPSLKRLRVPLLALVLLGVLSNRTFLAWTSSGLETALFNFCVTLWVYCALFLPANRPAWLVGLSLSAALAYLTRPDGLLFALATLLLVGLAWGVEWTRTRRLSGGSVAAAAPLLAVPAHLLWRHAFYGAWLPNTYYAKAVEGRIWWESGGRYFLSFVMEYFLWAWVLLLGMVALVGFLNLRRRPARLVGLDLPLAEMIAAPDQAFDQLPAGRLKGLNLGWVLLAQALLGLGTAALGQPWLGAALVAAAIGAVALTGLLNLSLVQSAVAGVLGVHFLYYTVIIGGDHFEFRVYSHLVLLLFVSFLALLNRVRAGPRLAIALLGVWILLSWPIPWTHWAITHTLQTRKETGTLVAPVTPPLHQELPYLPQPVVRYLKTFDRMQAWLIQHAVGMRHQEHKIFWEYLVGFFPSRQVGEQISGEGYPVFAATSVGVVSWSLPHVAIIDTLGLNDYVIARNPISAPPQRMAHERKAPANYVECFEPNVNFLPEGVTISPRPVPLTAERIVECEQNYAAQIAHR